MNRLLALAEAEPDATGTRWAVARTCRGVYLCARFEDGREVIEVKHAEVGRRAYRTARPPGHLCWRPIVRRSTG